jgi:hypothetical protein
MFTNSFFIYCQRVVKIIMIKMQMGKLIGEIKKLRIKQRIKETIMENKIKN